MSYKLLNLVSNYVGSGVYTNRLELGESGLNGPVDIRFIDEPGWIENVHSVFFSVNGRDAYYPTSTGGMISTSVAGDLVFFDPSNENGRTLSQLYAGAAGGLWEDTGLYTRLLAIRAIDMQYESIIHVDEIIGGIAAGGFNISAISGEVLSFYDDATGTKTLSELAAGGGVTAHSALTQLDYASAGHTGFAGNPMTGDLDADGHDIMELSQLFGKVESGFTWDLIFWGSNVGGTAAVEMMRWDASLQNINVAGKKITNLAAATNPSDAARFDQIGGGGVTAHSALTELDYASAGHTGFSPDTHTHDGRYYTETEINTWRNGTTQTEMGYVNEVSSSIQDQLNARLPLAAGSGNPLSGDLYVGNNDIIDCKNIKGDTTGTDGADRLNLDFRGDAKHRIYYTGISDNRLGYKTTTIHAFAVGDPTAVTIAHIDADGLHMQTGKYIKSSGGDLELRAPSGQMIKFVIG